MAPRISVVLPLYNAGPYLRPAIDSILNQTYSDFELIIIDDGSTDGSDKVIASYHDPRIRVYTQENKGVMASLNRGLELSRGQYIARMDHDDVSDPRRFQQQVEFLDSHPDHVVVGTTYAYIDPVNRLLGVFPALLRDEDLRRELITKSPLAHGSTVIRGSVIREHLIRYQSTYIDDYDLWMRLAGFGKMANLPAVLYFWRHHPGSIMSLHYDQQRTESRILQDAVFPKLDIGQLSSWPGWHRLQRYENEQVIIQGTKLRIDRRNAHSSMYLNLGLFLARHKRFWPAIKTLWYSVLIQPLYPPLALGRRLFSVQSHENLLRQ
ncbi:MAG: glycosyltransferase family 2 protein [Candidatus Kerfeldbacteria bacterium]|nr:glycosyltransferase family 2 protein [Candidatus Kerfeldbacteria bacterium]